MCVGPDGKRAYVVRTVNDAEAAIVRRIFEWSAAGVGLTGITKRLNEAGAPAPRPQQGRPVAWASSSVRAVLRRPLYRGEIVWNQTRKRDGWGQANRRQRAAEEWLRVPVPDLRIVSPKLWKAADRARATREAQYAIGGRSHRASSYLLSGFARCAGCGGGFASHSRSHGKHRVLFYACTSHWKRGPAVCGNGLVGRMDVIDAEVLATLATDILRPSVVEHAIKLASTRCGRRDNRKRRRRSPPTPTVHAQNVSGSRTRFSAAGRSMCWLTVSERRRRDEWRSTGNLPLDRRSPVLCSLVTWRGVYGRSSPTGGRC